MRALRHLLVLAAVGLAIVAPPPAAGAEPASASLSGFSTALVEVSIGTREGHVGFEAVASARIPDANVTTLSLWLLDADGRTLGMARKSVSPAGSLLEFHSDHVDVTPWSSASRETGATTLYVGLSGWVNATTHALFRVVAVSPVENATLDFTAFGEGPLALSSKLGHGNVRVLHPRAWEGASLATGGGSLYLAKTGWSTQRTLIAVAQHDGLNAGSGTLRYETADGCVVEKVFATQSVRRDARCPEGAAPPAFAYTSANSEAFVSRAKGDWALELSAFLPHTARDSVYVLVADVEGL